MSTIPELLEAWRQAERDYLRGDGNTVSLLTAMHEAATDLINAYQGVATQPYGAPYADLVKQFEANAHCAPEDPASCAWQDAADLLRDAMNAKPRARVILFRRSGKYYTEEEWKVPEGAIGPYDMKRSPDFRRIDGGPVLVDSQEPWGYPHLFPSDD